MKSTYLAAESWKGEWEETAAIFNAELDKLIEAHGQAIKAHGWISWPPTLR